MHQVRELGRKVALGQMPPASYGENTCPVCGSDFFYLEGNEAECPVCGSRAKVMEEAGELRLDFSEGLSKRWTPEGLHEHVNDWIKRTGVRFMQVRHQVKERRKRLEGIPIQWLKRPKEEGG
ncbi:MAG TPA: hypothetical protein ENG33_05930 [Chloroflexi bacterium]|nr:hypothetical protein [Chloroflexota bacterium]